jgi:hypothetical protein
MLFKILEGFNKEKELVSRENFKADIREKISNVFPLMLVTTDNSGRQ